MLLRKYVLPAEVLIRTTSVLLPVATLSHNSGITTKVTCQQPHATTIRSFTDEHRFYFRVGISPGNTVANPKGKLKAITTRSGLVTDGPTVPTPPKSVTPEEDECVEETYMDPNLAEYTIKVPPPPMTLELANRAICTPDGIARDVFIPVGKFTFPADFVFVDYERDPKVPLILGRPFLRTARALIDVHGEEMILRDGDESEDCLEDSVSHNQSGNPSFSLHKEITSPEVTHEIHDSEGSNFLYKELLDIDSFNDIHPHFDDNPLSGCTTYSSNSLLEEFTDELALITYLSDYDDNLKCDIESDLREIEFLLYQGKDFDLKDSIDQTDLANRDDLFVDPIPEMFTDEHAPNYSFPPRFDVVDDLPSLDNEDKVFNPGILIQEKSVKIITRVAQEKKLAISYASLVFEAFDPLFYEPLVFKDVPQSMKLLLFSSKNKEKVFKPGIYTSEKVHSCFLLELSHLAGKKYYIIDPGQLGKYRVDSVWVRIRCIFHLAQTYKSPSVGYSSPKVYSSSTANVNFTQAFYSINLPK
nr:reverse transcriptase domain-containing protein [Tanacetum cinerariifolium]